MALSNCGKGRTVGGTTTGSVAATSSTRTTYPRGAAPDVRSCTNGRVSRYGLSTTTRGTARRSGPDPVTALLVPFRFGDDTHRERAWAYVRGWYQQRHPGFRLIVGECRHGEPWSKGRALQRAFERIYSERVIVVADADVLVSPGVLEGCVQVVASGERAWAQPHDTVYRLSRSATVALIRRGADAVIKPLGTPSLERRKHAAAHGGGILVTTVDAYADVGGIDPRFVGWGGDDISFARALDTLVGPCARSAAPLWHLWHPRAERRPGNRASEASEDLAARYLVASGNVDAMRKIVDEIKWPALRS